MDFALFMMLIDIVGSFFFCLSGALAARQMQFDWWGTFVLALATGTGGGTLRSFMIGDFPVPILKSPLYIFISILVVPCAIYFPKYISKVKRQVSIIDALGLGLFSVAGTQIAHDAGLHWWASIGMGAVSSTFGGVMRDIIRNEIPLVFRKEIYASAALMGGTLSLFLQYCGMEVEPAMLLCVFFTAAIRLCAIHYAINYSSD